MGEGKAGLRGGSECCSACVDGETATAPPNGGLDDLAVHRLSSSTMASSSGGDGFRGLSWASASRRRFGKLDAQLPVGSQFELEKLRN